MREIKFRGIDIITEKFVYGYFIMFSDGSSYVLEHNDSDDTFNKINVYSNTIGQFTGLKDKNGVEIYEGDILLNHENYKCKVFWCKIQSQFRIVEIGQNKDFHSRNIIEIYNEVIGNIHENPELLNQ